MMNKTARLKRLSRHLLATTCLTLAGVGAAHATTINEMTQGPGAPTGDFSNSAASPTVLSSLPGVTLTPATGDTVDGIVRPGDLVDAFSFTGEPAGNLFLLTESSSRAAGTMEVLNSSEGVILTTFGLTTSQVAYSAVVPNDGILNVVVNYGICGECGIDYTIGVQAPVAPEPGTFAEIGLGLGLAGAVALRRRRQIRNA
jgi:hypothetical protein